MNERRRPPRRGRGKRPSNPAGAETGDNPYREDADTAAQRRRGRTAASEQVETEAPPPAPYPPERAPSDPRRPKRRLPRLPEPSSERDDAGRAPASAARMAALGAARNATTGNGGTGDARNEVR